MNRPRRDLRPDPPVDHDALRRRLEAATEAKTAEARATAPYRGTEHVARGKTISMISREAAGQEPDQEKPR